MNPLKSIFTLSLLTLATGLHAETAQNSETRVAKHQTRIIGGEAVKTGSYPFMTALVSRGRSVFDGQACGASYIGERYVLTAAHCVDGSRAENLDVWIGGTDLKNEEEGQRIKVVQIYDHIEYDATSTNIDIAVLELEREVTGITPIKLITPDIEASLAVGTQLTVMGWGNTSTSEEPSYPQALRQVNVALFDRAQCNAAESYNGEISDYMLCAGFIEGGKDSCQGDSGGPLVFKHDDEWMQIGVVSFGEGCALPNFPGVYTRLSKFVDWIKARRSGISYQQNHDLGYVEETFDNATRYEITNHGETAFSVTHINLSADNLTSPTIETNTCEGKALSKNETCAFTVKTQVASVGDASLDVSVNTTHPDAASIQFRNKLTALAKSSKDYGKQLSTNAPAIDWYEGGAQAWEVQTSKVSEGETALVSGTINHNENSVLMAIVDNTRINTLSVDYLVSSEEGYDGLQVYINGQYLDGFSGTEQEQFSKLALPLQAGKNRITFIYSKDDMESDGDDKAYLDNLKADYQNTAPEAKVASTSLTVTEGESFTLDASLSSDADGDSLQFNWKVVGDTAVTITGDKEAKAISKAPKHSEAKQLTFEVTVSDNFGGSNKVTVTVNVQKKKSGGSSSFLWLFTLGLLSLCRRAR